MIKAFKKLLNKISKKIEIAPWYIKIFMGSWVSLYTSVIIWFLLTNWNLDLYEGQILKIIAIYIIATLAYSWLFTVYTYYLFKDNKVLLSLFNIILHSIFIYILTLGLLLYPAYDITKKKIIGTNYTLNNTEVVYLFSQEINKLNRVYYKHNIKILYKNNTIIYFLKNLSDDYNKQDVLSNLLDYSLNQHLNFHQGKYLVKEEFNLLNKIMLDNKINKFSNNDIILVLDFILDNYSNTCNYKSSISNDEFKALSLPVRYFVKLLKNNNIKLHNDVMNTGLLRCFYTK
jgi:hypothetical protein